MNKTFSDVKEAFDRAESWIKKLELESTEREEIGSECYPCESEDECSGILVPALNELRYAGFHLCSAAVLEDGSSDSQLHLVKAYNHCVRASFDVLDATFVFYMSDCVLFQKDYRNVVISQVIPEYASQKVTLEKLKRGVQRTKHDTPEEIDANLLELSKNLETVKNISEIWESSREELNKLVLEKVECRRSNWVIAVASAVIGAILGVVGSIVTDIFRH